MKTRIWTPLLAALLALAWSAVMPEAATAAPAGEKGYDQAYGTGKATVTEDLYAPSRIPRHTRKVVFRARSLRRRGAAQEAADLLREHLADHPNQDHDLLRYHLGQALMDLDGSEEALTEFSRAVAMQPALDRAWIGLGDAAYQLKQYGRAAEAFERGFRLSPDRPVAILYYAATCALLDGQSPRSLALHKELVSGRWGDVRQEWYRGLAQSALAVERPESVESELQDLLTRFADDPDAWYLVYQFSVGAKDFRRAAVALTVTGYLRDLTEQESRQLGDLYAVTGVPALSVEAYRQALGSEATAEGYEKLASACLASHRTDQALAVLDEALANAPSPRLWSLKGDVHYLRKEYQESRVAFAQVLDKAPDNGRAHLMVGYCALELGDRSLALDHLGRAVNDPDQADMAQALIQRALKLQEG